MNPKWQGATALILAIISAIVGGTVGSCTTSAEPPTEYHAPITTLSD